MSITVIAFVIAVSIRVKAALMANEIDIAHEMLSEREILRDDLPKVIQEDIKKFKQKICALRSDFPKNISWQKLYENFSNTILTVIAKGIQETVKAKIIERARLNNFDFNVLDNDWWERLKKGEEFPALSSYMTSDELRLITLDLSNLANWRELLKDKREFPELERYFTPKEVALITNAIEVVLDSLSQREGMLPVMTEGFYVPTMLSEVLGIKDLDNKFNALAKEVARYQRSSNTHATSSSSSELQEVVIDEEAERQEDESLLRHHWKAHSP
jgi:hypothetical protein